MARRKSSLQAAMARASDPRDVLRNWNNMGTAARAMASGRTQRSSSGGVGPVPSGLGKSKAGVVDKSDPRAWTKMTGGLRSSTVASPITSMNTATGQSRVVGVNQKTTQFPTIGLGDLGSAMARDVEAQKEAAAQARQAAEESIEDVNQQYREAMGNLRESLQAANVERASQSAKIEDRVSSAYDEAMAYTKQQNEQVETATGRLEDAALEERNLQREKFKDTYALRMSTIVDGLRGQLDQDLSMIDEAVAKGQITGRGSMGATEVAQQMKEQTRQTHLDRLASVAADVGDKYNKSHQQMLQTSAQQYLQTVQAATQLEAQTGQQAAGTVAQIADGIARAMPAIEQQRAQGDLAALQQELAIEQLGVRRPELAAEIRLSTAYLPEAVNEYGMWREMYEMQQLNTANEDYSPIASSMSATSRPTGVFRWGSGGSQSKPSGGGAGRSKPSGGEGRGNPTGGGEGRKPKNTENPPLY